MKRPCTSVLGSKDANSIVRKLFRNPHFPPIRNAPEIKGNFSISPFSVIHWCKTPCRNLLNSVRKVEEVFETPLRFQANLDLAATNFDADDSGFISFALLRLTLLSEQLSIK